MDHDLTIATIREMMVDMPKSSPFERITLLTVSCDNKPLKMTHLARQVGITQGALTTVVDRLIATSLVKRVYDESDRRISMVQLTGKGAKLIARAERRATEVAAA